MTDNMRIRNIKQLMQTQMMQRDNKKNYKIIPINILKKIEELVGKQMTT